MIIPTSRDIRIICVSTSESTKWRGSLLVEGVEMCCIDGLSSAAEANAAIEYLLFGYKLGWNSMQGASEAMTDAGVEALNDAAAESDEWADGIVPKAVVVNRIFAAMQWQRVIDLSNGDQPS